MSAGLGCSECEPSTKIVQPAVTEFMTRLAMDPGVEPIVSPSRHDVEVQVPNRLIRVPPTGVKDIDTESADCASHLLSEPLNQEHNLLEIVRRDVLHADRVHVRDHQGVSRRKPSLLPR